MIQPRSGVIIAAGMVFGNLGNYGFQVLTGRMLSPENYGLLAGFLGAVAVITVSTSALQTTAAQAIATGENTPARRERVDTLTRSALRGSVVAGLVLIAFSPLISRALHSAVSPIVLLGLYVLPWAGLQVPVAGTSTVDTAEGLRQTRKLLPVITAHVGWAF